MNIESLKDFEIVGSIYENRNLWSSFKDYSETNSDGIDAMIIFVGAYAYEHQGRSPNFAHAATDVIKESKQQGSAAEAIDASKAWAEFREKIISLKPDTKLMSESEKNTRVAANVNPMAPRSTEFEITKKETVLTILSRRHLNSRGLGYNGQDQIAGSTLNSVLFIATR